MEHRIRAAGILLEQNKLLLLKVKDKFGEYYIPPGGGLETGDISTVDCLQREFYEETNLKVDIGPLICVREFVEQEPNRYHAEFFYQIVAHQGETSTSNLDGLNDQDYIQQICWVPIEQLSKLKTFPADLHQTVIPLIQKQCFSHHLGSYLQGENDHVNQLRKARERGIVKNIQSNLC